MIENSRPVIVARWIEEGGRSYLETEKTRVALDPERLDELARVYRLANGRTTVADLASDDLPLPELQSFFAALEELGIAFASENLAMYGHVAAKYPDPLRVVPPLERIKELMQPPEDRAGERYPLGVREREGLARRRTVRSFAPSELKRACLDEILFAAYGVVGEEGSRVIPSAGAMYPLQHDLFLFNVEDIPAGHYQLSRRSNVLIRLSDTSWEELSDCLYPDSFGDAAALHVIGFDIRRSAEKYSSRAYRFALLEAGHSAQNAISVATENGIGTWEYGGYDDSRLERLCFLTEPTSGIATLIFYGEKS